MSQTDDNLQVSLYHQPELTEQDNAPLSTLIPVGVEMHGQFSDEETVRIFIRKQVWTEMEAFAIADTSRERAGILLGYSQPNGNYMEVIIDNWLEAKHTSAVRTKVTFTHSTWKDIYRRQESEYPEMCIVGWYHTHPGFGVYLSDYDQFIQTNFFNLDWQVASVIDPLKQEGGFFLWKNKQISKATGYATYDKLLTEGEGQPLPQKPIEIELHNAIKDTMAKEKRPRLSPFVTACLALILLAFSTSIFFWHSTNTRLNETLASLDIVHIELKELRSKMGLATTTTSVISYNVKSGDTLWSIAGSLLHDPNRYIEIAQWNRLNLEDPLFPSQMIFLILD